VPAHRIIGVDDFRRPKIEAIPTPALRTRLTRVASIVEFRQQDGKPVKVVAHPPDWLTKAVLSAGVWPGIRPLEAVVGAPVLLPDGSVLQRAGYHRDSGLLYEPDVVYPTISDRTFARRRPAGYGGVA